MDERSSGSATQIRRESGRRSGGRKRRSASSVGMKSGRGGENGWTQRTHTGSKKMRWGRRESAMWTRRSLKTWETLQKRRWSLPKRRERTRKESGCEIRWEKKRFSDHQPVHLSKTPSFISSGPTCNPVVPTRGQEPQSNHGSRTRVCRQETGRRGRENVWQSRRLSRVWAVMCLVTVAAAMWRCGATASSAQGLRGADQRSLLCLNVTLFIFICQKH